jgi:hypothetical protein
MYELITDPYVGRGKSTDLIGSSFATAAATVHNEGLGVSFVFDSINDDIEDLIHELCGVIDGVLYFDHSTGKYEIALARDDYDPDALTTYDEDDFWVEEFHRESPGNTPSRVTVKYKDRYTGSDVTSSDDDIALLEIQDDFPVIRELDYRNLVRSADVAATIAAREQKQFSLMPANLRLRCLRTMADLHIGSVIKISYSALGIVTMIVRVIAVDYGDLDDDDVKIEVLEDVFGAAYTVFGTPGAPASGPSGDSPDTTLTWKWSTDSTETGPY